MHRPRWCCAWRTSKWTRSRSWKSISSSCPTRRSLVSSRSYLYIYRYLSASRSLAFKLIRPRWTSSLTRASSCTKRAAWTRTGSRFCASCWKFIRSAARTTSRRSSWSRSTVYCSPPLSPRTRKFQRWPRSTWLPRRMTWTPWVGSQTCYRSLAGSWSFPPWSWSRASQRTLRRSRRSWYRCSSRSRIVRTRTCVRLVLPLSPS